MPGTDLREIQVGCIEMAVDSLKTEYLSCLYDHAASRDKLIIVSASWLGGKFTVNPIASFSPF